MILQAAATLKVLKDRNTWEAFAWNRSECGLREALETIVEDIEGAALELEDAWQEYHRLYK